MSGAFKPIKDVCTSGVIDLVKWVSIGLLDSHCIAERSKYKISIRLMDSN